ncbi:secY/secA suppressor protein [Shimwellia pseudoproteus]|uniref:MysB family protein n=1 Tax=Shimwellia pseudoproteus TaxID=570012 RepID=UPI0018EB70C4|nr:MysB family protein [Shimwellia pseudoproteus]MBJ3815974.1 secY/secA suppressor protein [Shimwellia pseudoproteus]
MSSHDDTFYYTLDEAIDAAREAFLAAHTLEESDANVEQLSVQKYIMQDGDEMWRAEFLGDDDEDPADCIPLLSGVAAQSVFDGDYEIGEIRQQWQEENTLHEWDNGEFQLEPPLDTEEGEAAADEWDER